MYVNSPFRSSNGTTSVSDYSIGMRWGNALGVTYRFASAAEALASAENYNRFPGYVSGYTTRSLMANGRTGTRTFRNTPYQANYSRASSKGHVVTLTRGNSGNLWEVECMPIGFGLAPTPTNNSFANPLGAIHPDSGSLLNRQFMLQIQQRAIAEAKNKLAKASLDLSESLVDLPKTVLMVAEQAARFVYAWRSVRNGNYLLAAKHLGITKANVNFKSASSAWLAFQYGWKPLVSDIFGGIAEVNRLLNYDSTKPHLQVVRRIQNALIVDEILATAVWYNLDSAVQGDCSVEVKLRGRISDANLAYLTSLHLTNPLYTAWVATPFSFVIDWMIPVGDWLSSLSAPLGLQFLDGYMTTRTWGHAYIFGDRRTVHSAGQVYQYQTGIASASAEVAHMRRQIFTTWPLSLPYFRLPSLSPERIASAIALTKSRWR